VDRWCPVCTAWQEWHPQPGEINRSPWEIPCFSARSGLIWADERRAAIRWQNKSFLPESLMLLFGSTPGLRHSQAASWLPQVAKEGLRNFLARTISDRFPVDRTDPRHIEWFLDEAAKNDTPFIARFVGLMSTLDWTDRLREIKCPTLVVYPGAETVGSVSAYDAMGKRIPDVAVISYEGMPHNICDILPERCVDDVLTFLRWRFGAP